MEIYIEWNLGQTDNMIIISEKELPIPGPASPGQTTGAAS
jgi:hypothetical protein